MYKITLMLQLNIVEKYCHGSDKKKMVMNSIVVYMTTHTYCIKTGKR